MSYNILQQKKFLVTGAAGFIGSNLVRRLLSLNAEVVGVDDFSTGRRDNIEEIEDEFRFIETDISLSSNPLPSFEDVDYIIHLAAIPSVPMSVSNPVLVHRANSTGSLRILEIARKIQPENIVMASSCAVYGDVEEPPHEESQEVHPKSLYGATKVSMEQYAHSYIRMHDLPIILLRFFNVFGPYQNPDGDYASVIPSFIQRVQNHEPPVIYGDGEQTRDFTYINDTLEGILSAVTQPEYSGNAYNISADHQTTVNELAEKIIRISGRDLEPEHADPRPEDIRHSYASLDRAREDLEYVPTISLDEGLRRTFDWYQKR